jgi:tetratricopeptide (TPR) repeat protein
MAKPLPRNIYWFCYRAEDLAALPDWLKNHQNLVAVVPEEERASSLQPTDRELTLDATRVLDKLIQELELEAPELTRDPLGFFAKQLRQSLWSEDEAATADDVYAIRALIERVERARKREIAPEVVQPDLEAMREALRRSDYREAIRRARLIKLETLDPTLLREIAISMYGAAKSLFDDSEDELLGYQLTVEASDRAGTIEQNDPLALTVARSLVNRGIALRTLGHHRGAVAACDEVFRRFGDAADPALRDQVAKAWLNKGFALYALNRHTDAVAANDEVIRRFGDAANPLLRERVASALVNKGILLSIMNREGEAVEVLNDVLRRFGDVSDPALRTEVARALVTKAYAFDRLNRDKDAIAIYDQVIRDFADATDPTIRDQVAKARQNKELALAALNHREDAAAQPMGVASPDHIVGGPPDVTLNSRARRSGPARSRRRGGRG